MSLKNNLRGKSLLSLSSLTNEDILKIFEVAKVIRQKKQNHQLKLQNLDKSMALVFFEPSTRTRASFQFAGFNLGMPVHSQFYGNETSATKGEGEVDTILNILAMRPDILVVRYGDLPEVDEFLSNLATPVINGGSGRRGHPTQALGDLFTIWSERQNWQKEKLLLIGDINHSRVAASLMEICDKFQIEYGLCGPDGWLPNKGKHFNLVDGLKWCSVCVPLRIQWERHSDRDTSPWRDKEKYHRSFGISESSLKSFADGLILSPGPINFGVEMSREVMNDRRCRVLQQVDNGVFVRTALISEVLGIEIK